VVRSSIPDVATPSLSPDVDQRRVLDHEDGSLLLTGGPGTGKSSVLRERFARLIEGGADPERIALVVGSRRARDAARVALLERLPTSLPGLRVLTIHGLAHHVLRERHAALGYDEPPEILSAADQFAKVQELLEGQDRADWPAYGALLGMRGFADEVRQFLLRAQEALRTPEDIEEAATARALTGWAELARFYREYQQVMDSLNVVDFAMLLQRAGAAAAAGPGLLDHLLVDDFQDTTLAAEAVVRGIGVADLVVAGDPGAHVFSFQGTTNQPIAGFVTRTPGATTVELTTCHRAPEPPEVAAWVAPHTSEEHAAIARELRRRHVEDGVEWSDLAVVLRRQGAHLGGLLRSLDDARIPRAVPERGLSLTAEPATFPYVLALRWLVADPAKRDELIEPLLTSDVVGLSAATARGLLRVARATRGSIAEALDVTEVLSSEEASSLTGARDALAKAALFAGMSVQDSFRVLWEDLPCSRRLVSRGSAAGDPGPGSDAAEARRQLDTVVTFANVVAEAGGGADGSVAAFVDALDAGEHGPGYSAWERARPDAVQVLTAHGAAGQEFDTVIVAGAAEGNFPSLTRPEPMFDLAVLDRQVSRSERTRERLEDERRLFHMVMGRAKRRVILTVSEEHPEEDALTSRTRFADEVGAKWTSAPEGPFDDPVSVREASATWRRELADLRAPAALRLAALEGLLALGVDPRRWWFRRDWTDPGRRLDEDMRVSFSKLSKLDNCELQHVLSDELGLGTQAGYQAWVGKLVHKIIEDCETGALGRSREEILAAVDARWREQEFPSRAVSAAYRSLVEERFLPNWWHNYGETRSLAVEKTFAFEFDGVTINGVIDRIGPILSGGTRITDFKTGKPENGPKAEESLQLGIYYLAVQECEDLAVYRPVRAVELSYLKGHWKSGDIVLKAWQVNARSEEAYQERVRAELSRLVAEKKRLNDAEVYRPRPEADCFFCDFKTLCPLYPEGATPLLPQEVAP
jgi:superfamily I DNA/RNA helicase/RecB family exonuclease